MIGSFRNNSLKPDSNNSAGFTIIELMIATTVFSLVLMVCLAGIMQITKMYYQGVTQIRTQEIARTVTDEIAESIRFSVDTVTIPTESEEEVKHYCIGPKRYSYVINKQLSSKEPLADDQRMHALWVDRPQNCYDDTPLNMNEEQPSVYNGQELLAENTRLTDFEILEVIPDSLYKINVTVVYGDSDLIFDEGPDKPVTCKSAFVGAEFCAVSNISQTVNRRLGN